MTIYKILSGTSVNDVILADHDAVSALYHAPETKWDDEEIWNRKIAALQGDDVIVRDRVGDYSPGFVFDNGVGFSFETDGNVGVSGGAGTDTVDYHLSRGGLEIDLRPMGEAAANTFSVDVKNYFSIAEGGFARQYGANLDVLFGQDFLNGIENVIATTWNDRVTGSNGSNVLDGLDGDDKIWGLGGADLIYGGFGNDSIYGGTGADYLVGGNGNDKIDGGDQADSIFAGAGNDKVYGGDGADTINLGNGNNTGRGGEGDDLIGGGIGSDLLHGDEGRDTLIGGDGGDRLYGGEQGDVLNGGDGDDTLDGGSGTDTLYGGDGDDRVIGGSSPDYLYGGDGDDRLEVLGVEEVADGGAGTDLLRQTHTGAIDWVVTLGPGGGGWMTDSNGGNQTLLVSIEDVRMAGGADDVSFGGGLSNRAWGMAGDDRLVMGGGSDTAYGGAGDDEMFGGVGSDVLMGGPGHDLAYGGSGNDLLIGGKGDDGLYGGSGADKLVGGAGEEVIRGGAGVDLLTGGADADTFVWRTGDDGIDDLTDFTVGLDVIDHHSDTIFAAAAGGGTVLLGNADSDGFGRYFARLHDADIDAVVSAIDDGTLFGLTPPVIVELGF